MRRVKNTTWEFSLTKQDDEGTVMHTEKRTIDGNYPSNEILNEFMEQGWSVTRMTLLDTNYE